MGGPNTSLGQLRSFPYNEVAHLHVFSTAEFYWKKKTTTKKTKKQKNIHTYMLAKKTKNL